MPKGKPKGKQQTAVLGALDVFQCDNKDNGNVNGNINGNVNSPKATTPSPQSAAADLKDPMITNGTCERCPFNGDIVNEIICCSLCNKTFHALCRDKRANFTNTSISSRSFYEMFNSVTAHYGPNKDRWGRFIFICDPCNTKYSSSNDQFIVQLSLENGKDVDVVSECKGSQNLVKSQTDVAPLVNSNETQTIISGNINGSGYGSESDCSNSNDPNDDDYDDENSCNSIVNDIKSLLKTNKQILQGIKSIQAQSDNNSQLFTEQISEVQNNINTTLLNPISTILDSDTITKSITDQLSSPAIINSLQINSAANPSIAQKCKPYTDLHMEFLGEASLNSMAEFLGRCEGFKTIKAKENNSSRDVLYYGEFSYRYGATSHEAKQIPNEIQSVITEINTLYPQMLINSCLITRYKAGNNGCPMHSDDEPFIAPKSNIFTLSIGCKRDMNFSSVDGTSSATIELTNNSLLSFTRASQENWRHEIPSCTNATTRYSLTFRMLAPYYLNSTIIVGDSNTEHINFGSGRNKLGVWLPGERLKAGRIANIPSPAQLTTPFRHMVIHCGINDLRAHNHVPIPVIAKNLNDKCSALVNSFPKMKIHLSHILPTKDTGLNAMANELNKFINDIAKLHPNMAVISHSNMTDHNGKLDVNLGRHNTNGTSVHHDHVHLGSKGIALLCMNIKKCIIKMKANSENQSSPNHISNKSQFPYWFPNENYHPNMEAAIPQNNPWTGDHSWNFVERPHQSFLMSNSNNGYQS